jgi:electron transport complex protein RnfD
MIYVFIALCLPAAASVWVNGFNALSVILVSVFVAIAAHVLISLVVKRGEFSHPFSAMVTGMIVAMSYSFSVTATTPMVQQILPSVFVVAIISWGAEAIKKLQGFYHRKYVNPVAASNLLTLAIVPFRVLPVLAGPLHTAQEFFFFPVDHNNYNLINPGRFVTGVFLHYGSNSVESLIVLKAHGWLGGSSSITVLVAAVALIILCRGYIKWRIPLTYLVTMAALSAFYWLITGAGKYVPFDLQVAFYVFTGSVFFLAFFMATDPPTTPITHLGQIIFAIFLGILTFAFQLGLNFFGGSILALVIMNFTTPLLNRLGIRKPKKYGIPKVTQGPS